VKLIKYYLSHDDVRQRIARSGRQEVLQAHTWNHRVESLLRRVL